MGRGDKKTKRGKISMGSFGKTRPSRELVRKAATTATTAAAPKETKEAE